jgi:cation:H+ antiporter
MLINSLLLILGLIILIKGADWFVDGASALAKRFKVSDLAIGLTVVAFGTSAPELVINLMAAVEQQHDIVLGNIIGSNIFNLFAILGISGLIAPLAVQSSTVWKEIPLSLLAAILVLVLANPLFGGTDGVLSRIDGLILLIFFFGFLYYVYTQLATDSQTAAHSQEGLMSTGIMTSFIVVGLTGLVVGGRLVLDNAVDLATQLGVSEKVIGLTIVAAGTSLPELATSILAAIKKNNDIAVGNIIGSNIFNIFLILGASAVVSPISYSILFNRDVFVLIGGSVFLFSAMFMSGKKRLDRWEAVALLIAFVIYTTLLIV